MNNEPLRLRHQQSVMLNSYEKCPSTKRRRHWRPGGPAGAELGLTCGSRPCSTVWCLWRSRWRWAAAGTRRTAGTPRARTRRSPAGGSGLRWSACSPHTRRAGGGQRLEERGPRKTVRILTNTQSRLWRRLYGRVLRTPPSSRREASWPQDQDRDLLIL